MNVLSVPMKLDALVLLEDKAGLGTLVDFRRMPFSDNGVDINPDVLFLSSELMNEPFSEDFVLGRGCHLHWALPAMLTRTTQLTSAQKAAMVRSDSEERQFPPVPDRWVVRRTSTRLGPALWLIESDCYSSAPGGGAVFPLRTDAHGVKTVFLGRTTRLDRPAPAHDPDHDIGYLQPYLTAIGHGDPTFHAFYPNCRSVFGLFDAEATPETRGDLRYDVVGWYSRAELDHLAGTIHDLWSAEKVPGSDKSRLEQLRAANDRSLSDTQLVVSELERRFGPTRRCCRRSGLWAGTHLQRRSKKGPSVARGEPFMATIGPCPDRSWRKPRASRCSPRL